MEEKEHIEIIASLKLAKSAPKPQPKKKPQRNKKLDAALQKYFDLSTAHKASA